MGSVSYYPLPESQKNIRNKLELIGLDDFTKRHRTAISTVPQDAVDWHHRVEVKKRDTRLQTGSWLSFGPASRSKMETDSPNTKKALTAVKIPSHLASDLKWTVFVRGDGVGKLSDKLRR